MKREQIDVNLTKKTLSFRGKSLDLDGSLFDAESREDGEDTVLELQYRSEDVGLIDEADNIYLHLGGKAGEEYVTVGPCLDNCEYPTVSLFGAFDATIKH